MSERTCCVALPTTAGSGRNEIGDLRADDSSSWGNGHATLWRALGRALHRRGHEVVFYERDVPYYAAQRDLFAPHDVRLVLYQNWHEVKTAAHRDAADADVAMVTSYCPDAIEATALVIERARLSCFYDMDTPTTLAELESDSRVAYIGPAVCAISISC